MAAQPPLFIRIKAALLLLAGRLAFLLVVQRLLARRYAARCLGDHPARRPFAGGEGKPRILALHPERNQGDLKSLAASGLVQVLPMPFAWQSTLVSLYFPPSAWKASHPDIPQVYKERLRKFLAGFLPEFYRLLGVRAVVTPNFLYSQDQEWAQITRQTPVAFVALFKENMRDVDHATAEDVRRLWDRFRFQGDLIISGSQGVGRLMEQSGVAGPDRIVAGGIPRLDPFFQRLNSDLSHLDYQAIPRRAALFSLQHRPLGSIMKSPGEQNLGLFVKRGQPAMWKLFDQTHQSFARLAQKHPDAEFVIKTKWGGHWIEAIQESYQMAGIDSSAIPNLTITEKGNPVDLILSSRAVIGFNSTCQLESLAAGRRLIIPFFAEPAEDDFYRKFVYFVGEDQVFYFARSPEEMDEMVLAGLADPRPDNDPDQCKRLLLKFFHRIDGQAGPACARLILQAAETKSGGHPAA